MKEIFIITIEKADISRWAIKNRLEQILNTMDIEYDINYKE